jgi:hypothetical protein
VLCKLYRSITKRTESRIKTLSWAISVQFSTHSILLMLFFWAVTPCWLSGTYQRSGKKIMFPSSGLVPTYKSTRRHNPEQHRHFCRDNLMSHITLSFLKTHFNINLLPTRRRPSGLIPCLGFSDYVIYEYFISPTCGIYPSHLTSLLFNHCTSIIWREQTTFYLFFLILRHILSVLTVMCHTPTPTVRMFIIKQ